MLSFFENRLNLKDVFPATETNRLGVGWGENVAEKFTFENRNLHLMCDSPLTDSELTLEPYIP